MTHTKKPWHIFKCRYSTKSPVHEVQIRDAKGNILAVTASYGQHAGAPLDEKTKLANARLMALAPQMLALLRTMLHEHELKKLLVPEPEEQT